MKKEINFFRLALALTALTIYVYWPVGLHDFKILDLALLFKESEDIIRHKLRQHCLGVHYI